MTDKNRTTLLAILALLAMIAGFTGTHACAGIAGFLMFVLIIMDAKRLTGLAIALAIASLFMMAVCDIKMDRTPIIDKVGAICLLGFIAVAAGELLKKPMRDRGYQHGRGSHQ